MGVVRIFRTYPVPGTIDEKMRLRPCGSGPDKLDSSSLRAAGIYRHMGVVNGFHKQFSQISNPCDETGNCRKTQNRYLVGPLQWVYYKLTLEGRWHLHRGVV